MARVNSPAWRAAQNQQEQAAAAQAWLNSYDGDIEGIMGDNELGQALETLIPGAMGKISQGGNTSVMNLSENLGSFATTGNTSFLRGSETSMTDTQTGETTQTQAQTGGSDTTMDTTRDTTQTSDFATDQTSTQNTVGQEATDTAFDRTGTTTTGVSDDLGFGGLVRGQAEQQSSLDADRMGFLSGLINNGTGQLQDEVSNAVALSQSGRMGAGTGAAARGRMAGSAVGDVARQDLNTRFNAANAATSGSGLGEMAGQFSGLMGQQTTAQEAGTQTGQATTQAATTGTQAATGTNTTVGTDNTQVTGQERSFSDLTNTEFSNIIRNVDQAMEEGGSEAAFQAGISGLQSAGLQFGNQPIQKSGGGCMACTALASQGAWNNFRVLRRAINYKTVEQRQRYKRAAIGYWALESMWFYLATAPRLRKAFYGLTRAVVYQEIRLAAPHRLRPKLWPYVFHQFCHYTCVAISYVKPNRVGFKNPVLLRTAQRNNIVCEPFTKEQ